MFYIAISLFAVGIGVATLFTVSFAATVWLVLIGILLLVVMRRHSAGNFVGLLPAVAVALLMLSAGLLRTEWYELQFQYSQFTPVIDTETAFSGIVSKEPDVRERSTHLYVETGDETVLVTVDRHTPVAYGDELLIVGTIEVPESFETDLGRTFDYPGYLLAKEVTHLIRYAEVAVIRTDQANPIVSILLKVKHYLMYGIESVIVEPQAGLAEGLLLGVKQALGDDLETAFRQSGIIHIVVLSGYNVMLVVAFFRFFMRPLPRLWQFGLGVLAVMGFALIVGLSATVVRASIMAALVLFAGTFARTYDVLRALFFAGFIMLLSNPYLLLYDIGFQLSFMATLGLILVAPRLETALAEGSWFGVKEFFLATLATQIAVLPLLLYHIGEVSLVALVVNVLVLPVVPLAMLGAFVSGVLASILPSIALPVAHLSGLLLSYIMLVATWFAALPFAIAQVPAFSAWWILLMYGGMAGLYWLVVRKKASISLVGWEIVEEETAIQKSAAQRAALKEEVPIFFR